MACIDFHQTGFVGKGSDHLQLIKFWPSLAPGKGVCGRAKNFGSPLLQPACSVCVSLSAFSFLYYVYSLYELHVKLLLLLIVVVVVVVVVPVLVLELQSSTLQSWWDVHKHTSCESRLCPPACSRTSTTDPTSSYATQHINTATEAAPTPRKSFLMAIKTQWVYF